MDEWDRDVAELGERVAECLTQDMQVYSKLKDRAWHVVLVCYARVAWSCGPENVPLEWRPRFDARGMWHLPGGPD